MVRAAFGVSLLISLACRPSTEEGLGTERGAARPEPSFLVLQKLGSSAAFYTLEGELVGTVPVGKNPHEMILSADGRFAYVSDYGALGVEAEGEGGNTVSIIDIENREKTGLVDLGDFRRPHGIDLDPETGHLWVTTENPNRLLIINPESRKILADFETQGQASHMVTRGPDGKRAFVSNIGTENVSVIDLETGSVELIPVGKRPEGSDITRDGKTLYVACRESHVISVIDTETNAVLGNIQTGKGPNRVQLTADESTLVYSLVHDRQVGFADAASMQQTATVDLDGAPVSLQMSTDGHWALTASQGEDTVYVISVSDHQVDRKFETAEGAGPDPVLDIRR